MQFYTACNQVLKWVVDPVVLITGSPDQRQRRCLGTGWACAVSDPTADALSPKLGPGPSALSEQDSR